MKKILILCHILASISFSQFYFPNEYSEKTFKVSASNHFPKFDEVVDLHLTIKPPENLDGLQTEVGFVVYHLKDIEIVSGEPLPEMVLNKEVEISINIQVKFKSTRFYSIRAKLLKNVFVDFQFFVENSYRESSELKDIKYNIEELTNYIESNKLGKKVPFPGIAGRQLKTDDYREHSVFTGSTFEETIIEKTKKWNHDQYRMYKKKYDSLMIIANKIKGEHYLERIKKKISRHPKNKLQ